MVGTNIMFWIFMFFWIFSDVLDAVYFYLLYFLGCDYYSVVHIFVEIVVNGFGIIIAG